MRRRQTRPSSSSDDSDRPDCGSCFDVENELGETESDTNPVDVDTHVEGEDKVNTLWTAKKDKDHLLEYYLNYEEDLDESDDEDEYQSRTIVSSST